MADDAWNSLGRRSVLTGLLSISAGAVIRSPAMAQAAPGAALAKPPANAPYRDAALPVAERVEDLLSRMTLEEKVGQMVGIWEKKGSIQNARGDFIAAKATDVFPHGLGQISRPSDKRGVDPAANGAAGAANDNPNRTARETAEYVNAAQRWAIENTRLGIPIIMHEEALHGYVARGATSFPQAIGLASTFDPALVTRIFSMAAREMRGRGANLALAPVVDVARDPRWGRIEETFGEDPHVCAEMGLAAIRGFQGETLPLALDKVFVTLKHMTGHGQPENGTNVGPANISERTLRENFFPPFERAVKELPVMAVMASYNEIDGIPSHASRWLLHDILRTEWGYKGAVVSDYFAIRELNVRHRMYRTLDEAGVRALHAGVDIELPDGEGYVNLPALVRAGTVPQAEVDEAVRRLLTMKFLSGAFESPYVDVRRAGRFENAPDAVALAREAARKSMVLLKNEGGLLPLDASRIRKLAVLGTHARDTPIGGYSDVPAKVVSVLEGLEAEGQGKFEVVYSEAVKLTRSRSWSADAVDLIDPAENAALIQQAVADSRDADVIVMVLGDNEQLSREAWADGHLGDRDSLELVGQQNDLAKAVLALGKPTVVVLLNGRPLAINFLNENVPAIIEGWYLGQETGHAVADVLFGRANPGGKLPVSVARSVGQLPIFYNHKPTSRRGYLFDTTAPLYPFGYGLSYTTFDISAPRLARTSIRKGDTVRVSVDVANTGSRAGDEVVQLYVSDLTATVTRPVKELKHFKRVTLEPGARTTVEFDITSADLWMWNESMERVVEPGDFTLAAGPNSVDLKPVTLTVTE
ncbi:MAG: beta-glucosidase [Brevundimonas sp.]|nr:MAG: beta-glucosidase [Brevundimonas sp.]